MIDGDWQTRLESVEGIQEMDMDELGKVIDEKVLLSFPLFSRRIEYLRLLQKRATQYISSENNGRVNRCKNE